MAVSGASRSGLLNANDTAVFDTPASRATSAMRGRLGALLHSVVSRCGRLPSGSLRHDRADGDAGDPDGRSGAGRQAAMQDRFSKPV